MREKNAKKKNGNGKKKEEKTLLNHNVQCFALLCVGVKTESLISVLCYWKPSCLFLSPDLIPLASPPTSLSPTHMYLLFAPPPSRVTYTVNLRAIKILSPK